MLFALSISSSSATVVIAFVSRSKTLLAAISRKKKLYGCVSNYFIIK